MSKISAIPASEIKNRMASAKIQVSALAASDSRYTYFRLEWNDELHRNKAGAKPKKLFIDGKEAADKARTSNSA